jgi:hypothetical protein
VITLLEAEIGETDFRRIVVKHHFVAKHKQQQMEIQYETEHQIIRIDLWHRLGIGAFSSYTVSPIGSVIGLVYAFFDALIGGAIFAWLYNKIAGCAKDEKPSQP